MELAGLHIRRATVDDLPQLLELWRSENLPWQDLERRLTEFQVADDGTGQVLGAMGVHIHSQQGFIHSESYRHWELADQLRDLFWERLQSLSHNFALVRLWTRETAPYWHANGFQAPTAELRQKMPVHFGDRDGHWLVLSLRAEPAKPVVDLDKEFEIFQEAERARTEEAFKKARSLRTLALVLAGILFVGVVIGMSYLLFRSQGFRFP